MTYNLIFVSGNDVVDVEQCTYALTLVNKTLYEIDDQATFYDQSDFMEDLGIDKVTKLTSDEVPSTLLEEIQLYNVALKQEDGEQVTEEDISALYQVMIMMMMKLMKLMMMMMTMLMTLMNETRE